MEQPGRLHVAARARTAARVPRAGARCRSSIPQRIEPTRDPLRPTRVIPDESGSGPARRSCSGAGSVVAPIRRDAPPRHLPNLGHRSRDRDLRDHGRLPGSVRLGRPGGARRRLPRPRRGSVSGRLVPGSVLRFGRGPQGLPGRGCRTGRTGSRSGSLPGGVVLAHRRGRRRLFRVLSLPAAGCALPPFPRPPDLRRSRRSTGFLCSS